VERLIAEPSAQGARLRAEVEAAEADFTDHMFHKFDTRAAEVSLNRWGSAALLINTIDRPYLKGGTTLLGRDPLKRPLTKDSASHARTWQ
jgi:hypothetical protein